MSKTKKTLMFTSAILMIISGIVTGVLCCLLIFSAANFEKLVLKLSNTDASNYDQVQTVVQVVVSLITAGSVVGIVFGGISIKFCLYSPIEFYQKKSVVLTVAIICTIVVNIIVGALYIIAVTWPDENLKFEDDDENKKEVDVDKLMEKLEKLNEMKKQNLINEEEFEKLKHDILKGTALEEKSK